VGLGRFLARRIATFIPTIIGVIFLTYLIAYMIPANPVRAWVGGEKMVDPKLIERIRYEYKFDAPWYEQFTFLFTQLITGQLRDPVRGRLVIVSLGERFPITVELAIFGMMFLLIISIPLGIAAALKKDTPIDFAVRFLALFGSSMPSFVLYYLLILAFFTVLGMTYLAGIPEPTRPCRVFISNLPNSIPVIGHLASYIGSVPMFRAMMCGEWNVVNETFKRMWLPGLALGLLSGGFVARVLRNSLLDALGSEYVLFAKARGLSKFRVWKHALKNAMIPVVTVLGLQFGGFLAGAVIAETVFGIPGMGRYVYDAISRLNFPAIIGGTFLFAIVYVTVNLIVDILYAIIDPRVRY